MVIVWAALAVILSVLLVVGVHEAGHALAARLFHITIKRISIGFGRPLFTWRTRSGVEWVWALWPLGGYVHLLNTRNTMVSPEDYAFCFDKKPIGTRCIVLLSGIFANLLMAWLALVLLYSVGYQQRASDCQY